VIVTFCNWDVLEKVPKFTIFKRVIKDPVTNYVSFTFSSFRECFAVAQGRFSVVCKLCTAP